MKFHNVAIQALAYESPAEFVSSEQIESMLAPIYQRLKLPEGRLHLQTGIVTRGMWPKGERPSSIATRAAKKCLSQTQIDLNQIDCLIHASVCRDFLEPATASVVHAQLGLPASCAYFDLSNACLGVLTSLMLAGQMIESGAWRNCLIVSGENSGPLLLDTISYLNQSDISRKDIKKYIANLTIGSAGVAVLLSRIDHSRNVLAQVLGGVSQSDSSSNHLCQGGGNTDHLMMETDSEALLHAGVKLATATWSQFKQTMQWNDETYQKVIGHQVGVAHKTAMLNELKIDVTKDFSSFETWGNTGSCAVPLTLALALEQKFIKQGERVALLGIGSGLTSSMVGIQC
jgi:3-oxoacyl-[acyl-carrier-protein] synthase-3